MNETEDLAHRLEHGYPTTERKAAAALLRQQAAEIERLREIALLHYGHAKGFYMNKCIRCEQQMELVDKRCYVCADCAGKAIDAAIKENKHE